MLYANADDVISAVEGSLHHQEEAFLVSGIQAV